MLAALRFTFHRHAVVRRGAGAVAEGLFIEFAKRGSHFHTAFGWDVVVHHSNAVYRAFITVNHQRQRVTLQRFEITHDIAVFCFHAAAQAITATQCILKGVLIQRRRGGNFTHALLGHFR